MEAHEGISQLIIILALDVLIIDLLRNRVIDIEQCNGIVRSTHTDVLRERTIDINLASYRNAAANETAVYIARLETELAWECRPALVSECYILARTLVSLCPVEQCQLKLCHSATEVRIVAAFAHLLGHISANLVDTWVVLVLLVSYEKVEP